jgi:mersacidin/lichenicidin family type 2 lantibiotic
MRNEEIVRAWKDPDYAATLDCDARDGLPPNPAGTLEMHDKPMDDLAGAAIGMLGTGMACLTAISDAISCFNCDSLSWDVKSAI